MASLGERAADRVTAAFGSWRFLWFQTGVVITWMTLNTAALAHHWDPYPFILLNLLFSTQAAYAAPLILLAQNRSADNDRARAEADLEADLETLALLRAVADHLGVTADTAPQA